MWRGLGAQSRGFSREKSWRVFDARRANLFSCPATTFVSSPATDLTSAFSTRKKKQTPPPPPKRPCPRPPRRWDASTGAARSTACCRTRACSAAEERELPEEEGATTRSHRRRSRRPEELCRPAHRSTLRAAAPTSGRSSGERRCPVSVCFIVLCAMGGARASARRRISRGKGRRGEGLTWREKEPKLSSRNFPRGERERDRGEHALVPARPCSARFPARFPSPS